MPDERIEDGPRRLPRPDDDYSPAPRATSGKAITSLVLGILSIVVCLIGPVFLGVPAFILGLMALGDVKKKHLGGQGMAITGIALSMASFILVLPAMLIGLLLPAVAKVRDAATRMQSSNNLKQMSLAFANHAATFNDALPTNIYSKDGKPLLSWRVRILPFIEQNDLYRRFKLDEPWDGPNNIKLLPLMPKTYLIPNPKAREEIADGKTYYQMFVGPHALYSGKAPADLERQESGGPNYKSAFTIKGTSQTFLIVEAGTTVPWTKPEDLPFDRDGPLPQLGGHHNGIRFQAAFADCSVRSISSTVSDNTIKWAIRSDDPSLPPADWER
jgi:Protein of unknown function (DUF1559)/Domain of unknown function (DUF4190)